MNTVWQIAMYAAGIATGILLCWLRSRRRMLAERRRVRAYLVERDSRDRHRRSIAAKKGWETRRAKSAAEFRGFVDRNFEVKQTTPFPPVDVTEEGGAR